MVRNGSRYGRRSGSPRLRNCCRTDLDESLSTFDAGGRLALVGKNLRGSRAAALPAVTSCKCALRSSLSYRPEMARAIAHPSQATSLTRGQGVVSFGSEKNHLSHQTISSQSGRELLLTALFGRKSKPHEMWERVTALTLMSHGFRVSGTGQISRL